MAFGSFEGLYTFCEVAEIYGLDSSCLRKQVAREKFVIGCDIKKFGRTWVITEQAMVKNFGSLRFDDYKAKLAKKENVTKVDEEKVVKANKKSKKSKTKRARSSKKANSMNGKEENVKDSWVKSDIKGTELKSFSFNTNDSK